MPTASELRNGRQRSFGLRAGRRWLLWLSGLVLALAASGCGIGGNPPAAPEPLPEGITLTTYQTRSDVARRRIEVAVTNGATSALTITRMTFSAPQFAGPAEWKKDSTTIGPGVTANLPVLLPDTVCDADVAPPTVEFDYRFADGNAGTASGQAEDVFDQLGPLAAADCFDERVSQQVTVEATTEPRVDVVGGRLVAHLDVDVTPTAQIGTVMFESAQGSTLLAMADPRTAEILPFRPLGVTVDASTVKPGFTLELVPNRCDPHAIAEDKRGTIFLLSVTLDDTSSGNVFVASAPEVKSALYAYVKDACGLP